MAVTETIGVKEKIVSGKNSFASGLTPKKRSLRKDDGAEGDEDEEGDKEEESEDNEELSTDNANKTDAAAPADGWANFSPKSRTGDIEPPHKGLQKQKGSQANDNNSNGATVPELLTTLETTIQKTKRILVLDSQQWETSAYEEEETMKQRRELREE